MSCIFGSGYWDGGYGKEWVWGLVTISHRWRGSRVFLLVEEDIMGGNRGVVSNKGINKQEARHFKELLILTTFFVLSRDICSAQLL